MISLTRIPRPGWLLGGLTVALVATLGVSGSAAATEPLPTVPPGEPAAFASRPADPAVDHREAGELEFTLLTGDVVRMVTAPDGSVSGEVVRAAGPTGDIASTSPGWPSTATTTRTSIPYR